jgi:phospholipase C
MKPRPTLAIAAVAATVAIAVFASLQSAQGAGGPPAPTTPIEHLVVIFDENVSFDHYFGTYPHAANLAGETPFTADPGTPAANTLQNPVDLITTNPNSATPKRLTPAQSVTCDQDHDYTAEQQAFDNGAMDKFVESTGGGGCTDKSTVMDYYDGNTVTGLWNIAQHFALSDNFWGTTFGPSTPGALNLIAGTTHGATTGSSAENGTIIGDPNPIGDDCGNGTNSMSGQNIGNLMNTGGMTWGWFQGGFANCGETHTNAAGGTFGDYSAHHEPFQYFASTANLHHLPPSSTAMIGHTDQANHQYDLADFDTALQNGALPQVSFLKAATFEDGHPGSSGPVDEQRWIARVLDLVEQSPQWANTAVVITYDDSDGWYDHRYQSPQQGSNAPADALGGPGVCGPAPAGGDYLDRCGPGPRLPLLIASPWVKPNSIDTTQLEQTSIIHFIEDNWLGGARIGDQSFDARAASLTSMFDFGGATRAPKVYLDPTNGTVVGSPPSGLTVAPPKPPPPAPTPTPTTTTSTPAPAPPAPTPTVVVTKINPKIAVSAKRRGRKLLLTLKVTNLDAKQGKIGLAATLLKGKRALAKAKGTVRSQKLKLTLRTKSNIKAGKYSLRFVVTQGKSSRTVTKTLKLK